MNTATKIKLILLTPIFILLSHYLVVFIHEYAHAFSAWILGYKHNPFDLNYGGTSWGNLLLLSNIDQKVNNNLIYSLGHPGHVALIAFAGPAIVIALFFLSSWLIQNIKNYSLLLYFLLFINLWCLGGTYAYVPVRTFTPHGEMVDVLDIQQALNISPWWIYFFIGYLVIYMMWQFFTKTLISIYLNVGITSVMSRASLMITCVLILFGYCGLAGFVNQGEISHFISATSVLAIPGIIIALWPTRKWVKQQLKEYASNSVPHRISAGTPMN
ncbi:MAG: hypothetical protein P4M12_06435 [Gammaproteobacteria bacterium]|nr:hypothetical protein [Gammaproteobacteria bacterium]